MAPAAQDRGDAGGTWTSIGADQGRLFESELYAVRCSRHAAVLIMSGGSDFGVAGFKGTVWRTPDGGAHWTKVYLGPDDFHPIVDLEIAEDGTDQTMVAAVSDNSGNRHGGALRSIDNGQTWAPAIAGLPLMFQGSSLCPS